MNAGRLNALRLVLAFVGFGAALLGLAFEDRRLTWVAIAALLGSLLMRLMLRRGKPM
jgi:hypothetical protein